MPSPLEVVHERLRAFLLQLKPRFLSDGVDEARLTQLRRMTDHRIRQFSIGKPEITGLELCALLADERAGRFDAMADEAGLLRKGHLAAVLPTLGEDMGYLVESCLLLQVIGPERMKGYLRDFVAAKGEVAAPPAAAPKAAAAAMSPAVAQALAPLPELWSVPPPVLKALDQLRGTDAAVDLPAAELDREPATASLFRKLVNASTQRPAPPITTRKGMAALGPPLARRFVLSAALLAKLGPADANPFWHRSLTIAHAASQIAKASRLGHPDEHFSAGLMHDVGRLALAKSGRDGASPQEAGAAILERWRFPAGVVAAALHAADSPERIEELPLPREAMVVAALNGLLDGGDRRVWAGFLRVAAEGLPAILEPAAKLAQAGAAGIVEP